MRHRLRLIVASLLMLLLLAAPAAVPAPSQPAASPEAPSAQPQFAALTAAPSAPPTPVRPAGNPGSWYAGATPPDLDPSKPVLVFVHGKGGSAAVWWEETAYYGPNDMYAYAYGNGYRTAFVDLEPEGDMWVNGELLAQQLAEITDHFGVPGVVIITHSKGGVDANAAAAFYGAGAMVEKVITLSAPHWGTPLADLAYSTWTWWLAAILGLQSDATYVMQTGYMAWFRSVADGVDESVPYYTLSGRKCGPFLTALWWGCIYLAGEDDGAVPVPNAHKPGGTIVANGWWNHDEIKMGSRTWSSMAPLLQPGGSQASVAASGPEFTAGAPGNLLLRGGEVTGVTMGEEFPMETGVQVATITFLASSPAFSATLIAPDGAKHPVSMTNPDGLLSGGWGGSVELKAPAAGAWRFEVSAPERAGYLMVASLESGLKATLNLGTRVAAPGSPLPVAVSLSQEPATAGVNGVLSSGGVRLATFTGSQATVTLPKQEGVHNLTVTVTGSLADGSAFERTLVASVAVVPAGAKATWMER